ncbi:LysR family transcriptional regulator [Pseudonocardiaceae bacterium YIM PH 21723]|nr:LysR family transcriptional regulator [Pseudonocardiaceae bacterium YIM PH 21723]
MELEVRHLRVLVTVADAGSVSKAAAKLGLSQPSLSGQLKRIERVMGSPLFERSPTGVQPTAFGRFVLAKARTVLAEMAELRPDSTRRNSGEPRQRVVRIGGVPGPIVSRLALCLRRRYAAGAGMGDTEVHSHVEQSSISLMRLVGSDRLDGAVIEEFAGHELTEVPGVQRSELVPVEPVFVALAEHHRLADRRAIALEELAEESWIVDPLTDSGESSHLRTACQTAGFVPQIRHHATEAAAARGFVASGQCVSLAQATSHEGLGIVVRPLVGDPIVRRLEICWSDRGVIDGDTLRRAAIEAYLGIVDVNPSFAYWWAAHPEVHPNLD